MSFPNVVHGSEVDTFTADTLQGAPVGTKMIIEDGRVYRYCKNNSSNAMIVANLQQGAIPEVGKYGDQSVSDDHAAGSLVISTIAATTTNMAIDELVNGYFWSEQVAQLGPAQRIKSNTLITQGANTGTITPYFPLAIAINGSTDSDSISYIRNTWMNVIIAPTTETGLVAGVSVAAIGTSEWGWVLTHGPAKCQTSGSPVITAHVIAAGAAAGEITVAGNVADTYIGYFMSHEQGDEDGLFFFTIE